MDILYFIYRSDILLKGHKIITDLIKLYPKLFVQKESWFDRKQLPYDREEVQGTVEDLIATHFQIHLPIQALWDFLVDVFVHQTFNDGAFELLFNAMIADKSLLNRLMGRLILQRNIKNQITMFLDEYKDYIKMGLENAKLLLLSDDEQRRTIWFEKNKLAIKEFIRRLIINNKSDQLDQETKKRRYNEINGDLTPPANAEVNQLTFE